VGHVKKRIDAASALYLSKLKKDEAETAQPHHVLNS
jgi:hypothetical protein